MLKIYSTERSTQNFIMTHRLKPAHYAAGCYIRLLISLARKTDIIKRMGQDFNGDEKNHRKGYSPKIGVTVRSMSAPA